jgi:intein-encoded DNA endonuclease-like protein
MTVETKTDLLMESLVEFYKDKNYILELRDIIESKSILSLRLLDWFVTNYSKKYIIILNTGGPRGFNVYQNYKLQLKGFAKLNFDPFSRSGKLMFYYNDNDVDYIKTSCSQLCFFRWCFQHGILDYVKKNLESIENDMKVSLKVSKSLSLNKKRKSLSLSASRGIIKHHVSCIVDFN